MVTATIFREKNLGVWEKLRNVGEKYPGVGENLGNVA
jgi:hypothetical protein